MNVSTTVPPCVSVVVRVTDAWASEKEKNRTFAKIWQIVLSLDFAVTPQKYMFQCVWKFLLPKEKIGCMYFTLSLMPIFYIKNIFKISGTNRDVFYLELRMKKAGIVGDVHLIITTYKASVKSFQTVRCSFLHILRATFIGIPGSIIFHIVLPLFAYLPTKLWSWGWCLCLIHPSASRTFYGFQPRGTQIFEVWMIKFGCFMTSHLFYFYLFEF